MMDSPAGMRAAGPGKVRMASWALGASMAAMIGAAACGGNHDADFGSNGPVYTNAAIVPFDPARPADTLRFASLNMSIGFPVTQLLFTDMADTNIAYEVLDSLFKRYQRTLPSERIKGMAKVLVASDPDVIGLQEVMRFTKDGVLINDFLPELTAAIKAAGGPDYQVFDNPLNDTLLSGQLNGKIIRIAFNEGNAMLVRPGIKIAASANLLYFSLLPIPTSTGTVTQRALQYVKLETGKGITWQVYNTHLEVIKSFSSSQSLELRRLVDSVKVQNTAKEDGAPQIVMGDFNVDPRTDAFNVMREGGFMDTFDTASTDPGYTCCVEQSALWDPAAVFSNRRIDYVFGRHMTRVLDHYVTLKDPYLTSGGAQVLLSDHRMVVVRIVGQ